MILVTGATGTVGSRVVEQLLGAGAQFRIFARDPQRAAAIVGNEVEIVKGDFDDIAALDRALAGVDHLFLLTPSGPKQVGVEKTIADAAKRAGVEHIVKLSVLGASPLTPIEIDQWHWYSEKYIEKLDIPFTAVRPTFFMQNTLMFAQSVASEGVIHSPMGDGKVSMVDARDIAAVAVAALIQAGHMNRTYDITGPEAVSMEEVAEAIGAAIGKKVTYANVPPEAARQGMLGSGMPEWIMDDLLTYYEFFRAGAGELVTPVVERVKGSSAISYAEFARDYASAFSGGGGSMI